jgi:3D-(3,5/4)-trihydroxycyclohexane-1,2-dione acylhydrolase (decyclizing)
LIEARKQEKTSVVVIETDYSERVSGYESWWDVPIAEVSEVESVRASFKDYSAAKKKERYFL